MNIAFFNGVSGMIAFQRNMDIVSNNMANVNTTGYKKTTGSFVDLLYTKIDTNVEDEKLMVGHGVKSDYNDVVFSQGSLSATDNELDFAIVGDGFFGVELSDGSTGYTRDGSFAISLEGDSPYLVDSTGNYILDSAGARILLETNDDGSVDMSQVADILGIYTFPNPFGLKSFGNNIYTENEISGAATGGSAGSGDIGENEILQYSLELSTVNVADEMVDVIQTQRGFTLTSKIVQTADQIEEIINNLR